MTVPGDAGERESRVDEAIAEFLIAQDSGEAFDPIAWLERHADIRSDLEQFLEDQQIVVGRIGDSGNRTRDERDEVRSADPDETQEFVLGQATGIDEPRRVPARSPAFSRLAAPARIGHYRLVRLLGTGGMGQVHEGIDDAGNRFAVKLLLPAGSASPEVMDRFRQEGALASSIDHPRCVFVREADEDDGCPYIVMELMSGRTLKDLVREQGALPYRDAIAKMVDVCDGLLEAHDRGLVHRDVKPANCYLEANGRVKIGDFGLARSMDVDAGLTTTGSFLGTPLFASPEQVRGEAVDVRSDVYSVCATLYYLVTGQAPFESTNPTQVIARIVSDDPTPPSKLVPGLPRAIDRLVLQGLQRDRERRYQDLAALRAAMEPFVGEGERTAGRGRRFAAYALDSLLFGLIGGAQALAVGGIDAQHVPTIGQYLSIIGPMYLYLVLTEWGFGGSLGKLSVGLRVRDAIDGGAPRFWQILLRVTLFIFFTGAAVDLFLYLFVSRDDAPRWFAMQSIGYLAIEFLYLSPGLIRRRPKFLHDLWSRTRVVQRDRATRPVLAEAAPSVGEPVPSSGEAPERLGRFRLVGRLAIAGRRLGDEAVPGVGSHAVGNGAFGERAETWVAEDRGLRRQVWISVVPWGMRPSEARRRCVRSTRLRWLDGGEGANFRWDAYLAPEGAPLSLWTRERGALEWKFVRRILGSLLDETIAGRIDGTRVSVDDPSRIWLDRRGRAVLIDREATSASASSSSAERSDGAAASLDGTNGESSEVPAATAPSGDSEASEVRALGRMARTLTVGSNSLDDARSYGVIPLHARRLLQEMNGASDERGPDLQRVAERLRETEDRPTAVTPVARWIAVGLLLAAISPLIGLTVVLSRGVAYQGMARLAGALAALEVLDRREGDRFLAEQFATGLAPPLIAKLEELTPERRRELREELKRLYRNRLNSIGWIQRSLLSTDGFDDDYVERLQRKKLVYQRERPLSIALDEPEGPTSIRVGIDATDWSLVTEMTPDQVGELTVGSLNRTLLTLVGVVWGALLIWGTFFRGGWCLTWAGIRVVDRTGRPAPRWRMLIRSATIWTPAMLLTLSVMVADWLVPDSSWLASGLANLVLALPLIYAAAALGGPERSLQDRIAGTWLVPE